MQNIIWSEPLQLNVILIPPWSKKTSDPLTTASYPKVFRENQVKKVLIGVNAIESGMYIICFNGNKKEIINGL